MAQGTTSAPGQASGASRGRVFPRLLLAAGSILATVLLLALIEGLLVLADVNPPEPPRPIRLRTLAHTDVTPLVFDADLIFRLPPSASFLGYYRTNTLGYRGPDVTRNTPSGTWRIICIGDSCTFGLGVEEQQTHAARLESMLATAFGGDPAFEVLNLGVTGYSSLQNRRQVEGDVLDLHPDLVIWLTSGQNDAGLDWVSSDADRVAHYNSLRFALSQLRLARLAGLAADLARQQGEPEIEGRDEDRRFTRVPVDDTVANFLASVEACRAAGIAFLHTAYVMRPAAYARTPSLAERERRVLAAAKAHQVPVSDPRPELQSLAPDFAHVDLTHPNPTGHQLIAARLFASLVIADDLLPPSPRRNALRTFLRVRDEGLVGVASLDATTWEDLPVPPEPHGSAVPPRLAAGEIHLAAMKPDTPPAEAEALRRRARQIDEHVFPPDPLRRMLWGTAAPTPVTPEQVRRARTLAALDTALGLSPPPLDLRIPQALEARRQGDLDGCVTLLDQALETDPDNTEALFQRLNAHRDAARTALAAADLARLEALEPGSARVVELHGRDAIEQGRYAEAAVSLRSAVELAPMVSGNHYLLGRSLLELGRLDEAEVSLKNAYSISRHHADVPDLLTEIERRRVATPVVETPGEESP